MGNGNGDTFGYAEFGNWYDAYRADTLEPALDRAMDALQRALDDALSDRDLARIRSISGRVKSKRRTWRKISQPHYREQVTSVDDIPRVLDDLLGMRLTCTNLRDLEMVQVALENLPAHATRKRPLGLDPASERDYVDQPKESGYRGWHVNLDVQHEGTPVTCELQVRTLLQDSWGELTHEDTYSKSGELPPLVEVLSTRMADLLATLDDIAEDLRNELDRIDEAIVAETAGQPEGETIAPEIAFGPGADAADILLERWRSLDRPLEISSLAWALQNEFGAEVSDDWFGYGTFKRFLRAAIPEGEISGDRQVYLLPPGGAAERGRVRRTNDHLGRRHVDDSRRGPPAPPNRPRLPAGRNRTVATHLRALRRSLASRRRGDTVDSDGQPTHAVGPRPCPSDRRPAHAPPPRPRRQGRARHQRIGRATRCRPDR